MAERLHLLRFEEARGKRRLTYRTSICFSHQAFLPSDARIGGNSPLWVTLPVPFTIEEKKLASDHQRIQEEGKSRLKQLLQSEGYVCAVRLRKKMSR